MEEKERERNNDLNKWVRMEKRKIGQRGNDILSKRDAYNRNCEDGESLSREKQEKRQKKKDNLRKRKKEKKNITIAKKRR